MRHLRHTHHRVGTRGREQFDGIVNVLSSPEGRGRLKQHEHVWPILLARAKCCHEIHQHVEHRCLVGSQLTWTQERNVYAELPCDTGDLFVVCAHDDASESLARTRSLGRVRKQRTTGNKRKVLARNPFGSSTRRNDAQDVQY